MLVAHTLLAHTLFALAVISLTHATDYHHDDPHHNPHHDPHHDQPKIKVFQSNDDGWACAKIRAFKIVLEKSGFESFLVGPAIDRSGTASTEAPPTPVTNGCEYNTCPPGAPAIGFNKSDHSLNYVSSFPATVAKVGLPLAQKFFHGQPDIGLFGVNDGLNAGPTVMISGTVGGATTASKLGLPAIGFSALSNVAVVNDTYLNLKAGDASFTYAALAAKVATQLTSHPKPFLPRNITLNVNFPTAAGRCAHPDAFRFVFTRTLPNANVTDINICGSRHLPDDAGVLANTTTCQATISVLNATNKLDVGRETQQWVYDRLRPILSCK